MNFRKSFAASAVAAALTVVLSACGSAPKGDVAHGAELYAQCSACHAMQENTAGPKHCGLFGRTAGTVPGFGYSSAMKESGIVWDEKMLSEFLVSPFTYLPGTVMGFAGFPNEQDRVDLIAYLKQQTSDPSVCPAG
ncbi:MAG: cytochrome c family protein [Woeseia sp.]